MPTAFTVIKRLGSGTSAIVNLCRVNRSTSLANIVSAGSLVAVKCFAIARLHNQNNVVNEISILRRLSHTNIIKFIDIMWDSNSVYVITEYCNMGSLKEFIRKHLLLEPDARFFMRHLVSGMKYLRLQDIVHRDLKPENLLLMEDPSKTMLPVLKIADFGLSNVMQTSSSSSSSTPMLFAEKIGTLLYMAPEILESNFYDSRCDLWSIGAIFYELLVGTTPFSSQSEKGGIDALIMAIISPIPASINIPQDQKNQKNVSQEAADLVSGLLTRDPANRITFKELFESRYLDIAHTPGPQSLFIARKSMLAAIELDEQIGGYEAEAAEKVRAKVIKLYVEALEHMFGHLQFLRDRDGSEARRISAQINECMERVDVRKNEIAEIRRGCTTKLDASTNKKQEEFGKKI
ncbi:Serine/threonine-protein kinase ulk3, partial [Physocladia obscura]